MGGLGKTTLAKKVYHSSSIGCNDSSLLMYHLNLLDTRKTFDLKKHLKIIYICKMEDNAKIIWCEFMMS